MRIILRVGVAVLLLGCATIGMLSCSSDNSSAGPTDEGNADSLLAVANDSLSTLMDEVVNETLANPDSSLRPHDIDFTGLNALYQQALAASPNNDSARFGTAFTGLMSFLADPDLNDLYERFKNAYDTNGVLQRVSPVINIGGPILPTGVPLELSEFGSVLPNLTRFDHMVRLSAASNDPSMSELQDILETKLYPRVLAARNAMLAILQDPSFVFIVSPAMQGNPGASPIELDRADFHVITAALYGIEASLHVLFARDLDLVSYDRHGIEVALQQDSSFLSLRLDGADEMAAAKTALLAGESQVELALDALADEITGDPDQSNDLIPVYPSDASEIASMKADIVEFRSYFNGPKLLTITWGDSYCYYDDLGGLICYGKDTVEEMVDISQFFDNPVENHKLLLPRYTVTVADDSREYIDFATQHFDRTRYFNKLQSLYGSTDDTDPSLQQYGIYNHLPETGSSEYYEFIRYSQAVFGWDDHYSWSPNDSLYVYTYSSNNQYQYRDMYSMGQQIQICYTWDALSFDAWTFPNPTFNGLLPGMTSTQLQDYYVKYLGMWYRSECVYISL